MLLVSKIFMQLLIAISIATTSGCSSVGVEESAELSLEFAGIASIEYNTERQETSLNWLLANSNADSVSYKIHELQLESLDQLRLEVQDPSTMDGLAHRVYLFDNQDLAQRIVSEGKVLAQLGADITQFQLGTALNPNSNYAYVIKVNAEGIADPNTKVLLLQSRVKDFLATNTYTGCLTGVSASPGTITVNFENPEVASKIDIKRDGVLVFSTTNSLTTNFTDMGLAAGSQFTYSCEATIGSDIAVGTQALTLSPQDFSYEGCTSATALSESEIELAFAIPANADRMRIYRNSKEIFSTTKKSVTKFIDEGLKLGRSYEYLCEIDIGELTVEGSNVIEAMTLDPVQNTSFAGCTSVVSLSPTSTQIDFDFPTGAERVNVYRDGVQVFSSFSSDKTTFIDQDLKTGIDYDYSCELVINGRSKFGSEVSGGTIDVIANLGDSWSGCVSASALSTSSILVMFESSSDLDAVNIYRDGALAFNSTRSSVTQFIDRELLEGVTYTYTCEAISGDKTLTGGSVLTAKTLVNSPPEFTGPSAATALDGNRIRVNWLPAGGVPTDHYVVYYQHGSTLDYSTASSINVGGSLQSTVLTDIGDQLTYTIGVRACHDVEEIYCDTNTNSITLTTPDAGAPSTQGATSVVVNNGALQITAPWQHDDGLVTRRSVYLRTGGIGGANLANYNLNKHVSVSDPQTVPTAIEVTGILENTQYHVMVIDSDGTTASNARNPVTVTTSDLTAPPNFPGIASASQQDTSVEGQVTITWIAPTDWSDYAGFYVYTVEGSTLSQRSENCACTNLDCATNNKTTCVISGLDARRTYTFHVRAFDEAGNITELDPTTRSATVQTADTTAPQGVCCMSGNYDSSSEVVSLPFSQAVDNQYSGEAGAKITYRLYRKTSSDFADVSNPSGDGELIHSIADSSVVEDVGPFASQQVFYYSLCAQDASGNNACSGQSHQVSIPDIDTPTLSSVSHNYEENVISWNVSWSMSDGLSASSEMVATLYRLANQSPTGTATTNDEIVATGAGVTQFTSLNGVQNFDGYLHYLLVIEDEAGNTASEAFTIQDNNAVSVTRVHPNEAEASANSYILVEGSGFISGASITVGGENCTNSTVHSPTLISCVAPTLTSGNSYDIKVSNSDGSEGILLSGLSACTSGSCSLTCNNSPAANGSGFAGGDGSEGDPFLICDGTHLDAIRDEATNLYYLLGGNVDMSSYTGNSFAPISTNNAATFDAIVFDGSDYGVLNYTYHDTSANFVGLFGQQLTGVETKNLRILNIDIEGDDYVGALTGSGHVQKIRNVFTHGVVRGERHVGGVVGDLNGPIVISDVGSNVEIMTGIVDLSQIYIGGIAGQIRNDSVTNFEGQLFALGDITATGSGSSIGGVFGYMNQTVTPIWQTSVCYAKVDITASASNIVGGFVGNASSEIGIVNCQAYGDINAVNSVGGFIGSASTTDANSFVTSSAAYGNVTGSTGVGSFVGLANNLNISSSNAFGNVTGSSEVGGFVGHVDAAQVYRLNKAYGNITASGIYAGGFFGEVEGDSVNMYGNQALNQTVESSTTQAGGFGGSISGTNHSIIGNRATGGTVIAGGRMGGFIGDLIPDDNTLTMSNNYSNMTVNSPSGTNNVGGFAGLHAGLLNLRGNGAEGDVTVPNSSNVAGFIGWLSPGTGTQILSDNYATGDVLGLRDASGFIAIIDRDGASGAIVNLDHNHAAGSAHSSNTEDSNSSAAGFLSDVGNRGGMTVHISNSSATGHAAGRNASAFMLDDFDNLDDSTITNSYALGDVDCTNACSGFLLDADGATVEKSYHSGHVTGTTTSPAVRNTSGVVSISTDNFFDGTLYGTNSDNLFAAATTTEMQTQSTFNGESWDFSTPVWQMPDSGPPVLAAHNMGATFSSGPETYAITWNARSDASSYVIVARQNADPVFVPENGQTYTTGDSQGDDTILYAGASTSYNHTGFSDRHGWKYRLYILDGSNNYYHIDRLNLPDDICSNRVDGEWVYSPRDSERSTDGFCVMRYEAKNVNSTPVSQIKEVPWVSLTQAQAEAECNSLGSGFGLLSNAQWTSLAAHLTNVDDNWSNGSVGSGSLSTGHSDNNPSTTSAAGSDLQPCIGTNTISSCDDFTWNSQRRTMKLSNGERIWDLAGNAAEFVSDFDSSGKPGPDASWTDFRYIEDGSSYTKLSVIPSNAQKSWWKDTWIGSRGIGQYYSSSSGGVFVRGGRYDDPTNSVGIFQLDTSMSASDTSAKVGFRCAYSFGSN